MEPVSLAVVGAGLVGSKHARLVSSEPASSLVGICDVDSRRKSVAERFDVPFYQDLVALLAERKPEGVIIATPNGTHSAVAEVCTRNGMDMLIEKPIANTVAEARQIDQSAEDAGCHVLVGHHRRHNPLIQEARSIVQGDTLGRLIAVSMMWALLKPDDWYDVDWRLSPSERAGRSWSTSFTNWTSCASYAERSAKSTRNRARWRGGLEVEDSLSITLSFASGALGFDTGL